jgi:hypothetical protein
VDSADSKYFHFFLDKIDVATFLYFVKKQLGKGRDFVDIEFRNHLLDIVSINIGQKATLDVTKSYMLYHQIGCYIFATPVVHVILTQFLNQTCPPHMIRQSI